MVIKRVNKGPLAIESLSDLGVSGPTARESRSNSTFNFSLIRVAVSANQ